ncbi:MAG: hypothetical protein AAF518_09270 [Spirochaetota bacterium]
MKHILSLSTLLFLLTCSFGQVKLQAPEGAKLHLVVDAGSSGTRFCLYQIEKSSEQIHGSYCKSIPIAGAYGKCKSIYAENGIADLGESKGPPVILKGISEMEFASPGITSKISATALLGTGGFRRLPKAQAEQILAKIRKTFTDNKMQAQVRMISGEEEAEYAYYSIQQTHTTQENMGILEIGGASVQVAYSVGGVLRKVSDAIGIGASYEKVTEAVDYQEQCFQPPSEFFVRKKREGQTFQACKSLVKEKVFSPSALQRSFATPLGNTIKFYGMGKVWQAKFSHHETDVLQKTELETTAEKYCKLTVADLVDKDILEKFARRECYTYSYLVSLMESVGIEEIHNGEGQSFTRGAAIVPGIFSGCAVADTTTAEEPAK